MSEQRELVLERKDQAEGGHVAPGVMMTPAIGGDYWAYRVVLSDKQAMLGFPKFSTIGIGFAEEEDWNTNLPYLEETERIWAHIAHNKGDEQISDEDCIRAIAMIQEAAREDHG